MSISDLHPEDLLDREASGVITDAERAMLDAHLAHCSACRLERLVRADFAAELDADLPPVHATGGGASLLTRALETQEPEHAAPKEEKEIALRDELDELDEPPVRHASIRARAFRRRAGAMIIAAAVLMLASVAVAGGGKRVFAMLFPTAPADTSAEETSQAPTTTPKKKALHAPRVTARPNEADPSAPNVTNDDETSQEAPAPIVPIAPVVAPTACATAPQPIAPARVVTTSANEQRDRANTAPLGPATTASSDSASVAFADANAARRRGDHVAAQLGYRALLDKYDGAAEAGPARVAFARMLLDDGNAGAALPLFDRYLADGNTALREEAMVGRARSLEKLQRTDQERAAWHLLIASYPQSIHTARAEARIEELNRR